MSKKIFLIALLFLVVSVFACLPVGRAVTTVNAMTTQERQALITQITQQIAQLQVQLNQMLAAQGQNPSTPAGWCHTFNNNLRIGDTGDEVSALWIVLNIEFPGDVMHISYDHEGMGQSKTFGENTASAVTAFQQKYASEILTPNGLKNGNGYVGPATRRKLNALYGCSQSSGSTVTPTCTPIWNYGTWSTCSNLSQSRTNTQSNCSSLPSTQTETRSCSSDTIRTCTPIWNYGTWSACSNLSQSRTNTQSNCSSLPSTQTETRSCTLPIVDNTNADAKPVSVDIKVNNSDQILRVDSNGLNSATISWLAINADSCVASGAWNGSKLTFGSQRWLDKYGVYTITCTNAAGHTATDSVTIREPLSSPPFVDFTIDGVSQDSSTGSVTGQVDEKLGTSAYISWSATNADSCVASEDWSGTKATSGAELTDKFTQEKIYHYTISCSGPGGAVIKTVKVNSIALHVTMKANGSSGSINVPADTPITISWSKSVANAPNCSVSADDPNFNSLMSTTYFPNLAYGGEITQRFLDEVHYTYTISCIQTDGTSVSDSVTVNVTKSSVPWVALFANGISTPTVSIKNNTKVVLQWQSYNMVSCVGPDGSNLLNGTMVTDYLYSSYPYTKLYNVTCKDVAGNTVYDSVNIKIEPN